MLGSAFLATPSSANTKHSIGNHSPPNKHDTTSGDSARNHSGALRVSSHQQLGAPYPRSLVLRLGGSGAGVRRCSPFRDTTGGAMVLPHGVADADQGRVRNRY